MDIGYWSFYAFTYTTTRTMCVCNNTIDYKKAFDFDGISISLFIGWYTVFDVIRARVTGKEYLLDVLSTYIYN